MNREEISPTLNNLPIGGSSVLSEYDHGLKAMGLGELSSNLESHAREARLVGLLGLVFILAACRAEGRPTKSEAFDSVADQPPALVDETSSQDEFVEPTAELQVAVGLLESTEVATEEPEPTAEVVVLPLPTPMPEPTPEPTPTPTATPIPPTPTETPIPPPTATLEPTQPPLPPTLVPTEVPPPPEQGGFWGMISSCPDGVFQDGSAMPLHTWEDGEPYGLVVGKEGMLFSVSHVYNAEIMTSDISSINRVMIRTVHDRSRYPMYNDSFSHTVIPVGEVRDGVAVTAEAMAQAVQIGTHVWITRRAGDFVFYMYCDG